MSVVTACLSFLSMSGFGMGRSQGFGMNSLSNNIFNGTGKLFTEQFGYSDNYKHLACTVLRLTCDSFLMD